MSETPFQQSEVTPQRPKLASFCRRSRWTLRICLLCGLVAGVLWAVLQPSYLATSTLVFPTPQPAAPVPAKSTAAEVPPLPRTTLTPATARVLLHSRRARTDIIARLQAQYDLARRWCPLVPTAARPEALQVALARRLTYQVAAGGAFLVRASDSSPELARQMVAASNDELDSLIKDLKLDTSTELQQFLEQKVIEQDGISLGIRKALQKFEQDNHITSLPDQSRAVAEHYAALQNDLLQAKLDANVAAQRANLLVGAAAKSLEAFLDPVPGPYATIAPLYDKVVKLRTDLFLLRARLLDDDPQVLTKAKEMQAAQDLLDAEVKRQLKLLPSKDNPNATHPAVLQAVTAAVTAKTRIKGLEEAQQALAAQMKLLPEEQMIVTKLTADIEAHQAASKFYRDALLQSRLTNSSGHLYALLEKPVRPSSPLAATRLWRCGLGLLLGLLCGLAIPYIAWLRWKPAMEETAQPDDSAAQPSPPPLVEDSASAAE